MIEIDGVSYENKWDKDVERQEFLERAGLTVLRFDDKLVKQDIANVLFTIEGWIRNNGFALIVSGEHPP